MKSLLSRRIPSAALVVAALVLMVLAVFGQTFGFEFVNYDDDMYVVRNAQVRDGLTMEGTVWAFGNLALDNWHPLSLLSHMADVSLFGLKAGWHHAVSVAIHAATSVLLFLVLRSMTGALWRSAFVAALFAIHPLHVESVAWVAERKDVLSALFFVLTLGAYARYAKIFKGAKWTASLWSYLLVMLLFALALMSKPMVVTLPFVLLLLDYWPLERSRSVPLWKLFLEKSPLLAMSTAEALLTVLAQKKATVSFEDIPWNLRLGNALVSCLDYTLNLVWPRNLAVFYPYNMKGPGMLELGSAAGCLALVTLVCLLRIRSNRYLPVGWFWFLGMLVPVIGIVQVGCQSHADRYTYLPSIGLFIALTWGACDLLVRHVRPPLLSTAAALILCLLAGAAWCQTRYWHNSTTLWEHAMDCSGESSATMVNYSEVLLRNGRLDEATVIVNRALELYPTSYEAHNNLGAILSLKGKYEGAMERYRESLSLYPNDVTTHNNLGNCLQKMGRREEAISEFREAVRINSAFPEAWGNLGSALMAEGKFREAGEAFRKVIRYRPNDTMSHYMLSKCLLEQGSQREGFGELETTLRLDPDYAAAQNDLAWMLATAPEDGIRDGKRALKLALRADEAVSSSDPYLLDTLAAAYAETGDYTKALATARKALSLALKPDSGKPPEDLIAGLRREIRLYESGKPCRRGS